MNKTHPSRRFRRLVKAGVYSAAAFGAFAVSTAALPASQANVVDTPRIVNVAFQPVVGDLEVPLHDWSPITKPEPPALVEATIVMDPIPEPEPAPAPEPTPAPAPKKAAAPQTALPVVVPDPGSAQAIGHEQVLARGWGEDQFSCLVKLWTKESGWNAGANNPSSGAYGIPQALPGSKMASAGADWQTNPATQIKWGLGYIGDRYGNPCGAWAHSVSNNWY
jgi:hypothetical protein